MPRKATGSIGGAGQKPLDWRRLAWGGGFLAPLAVPAIAMRFTHEVDWSAGDFLVMGLMLAGLGLGLDRLFSRFDQRAIRVLGGMALAIVFLTVWAQLAVGLFA